MPDTIMQEHYWCTVYYGYLLVTSLLRNSVMMQNKSNFWHAQVNKIGYTLVRIHLSEGVAMDHLGLVDPQYLMSQ